MNARQTIMFMSALVAAAVGLLAVWRPAAVLRVHALENKADSAIATGEIAVSPAELATLMRNRHVSLALFDLRDEPAFNRFHIIDTRRIAPGNANLEIVRAQPQSTVKILIAGDDRTANAAYRALAVANTKRVYVLAGGIHSWLDLFGKPAADGSLGILAGALGERHPASDPGTERVTLPAFEARVKLGTGGAKKGPGGCGG
jgi:rhodanese-related sulfurtransferase